MPTCAKCGEKMLRVGLEQASSLGVVAEFECPSCHSRTQELIEKVKKNKHDYLR